MSTNKLLRYLLIAAAGLIIIAVIGKKAGWFGKSLMYDVVVEHPERRDVTQYITANGKIQPKTEVKLSPEISGEIVELFVKDGDQVKEGQLLVRLKPDIYISAKDQAEALVEQQKANLANARAQLVQVEAQNEQTKLSYNRNKKLYAEKTISEADWESAESAYKIAAANVESAKQSVLGADFAVNSAIANLKEAKENLNKTSIYAPMSGTVSALLVEKGERVAGNQFMAGTELLRIADLSKMELVVDVNENDIISVKLRDTANIEVDAYLDRKFKGVVTEIANSAVTTGLATDQVTNFQVKILLLKDSYKDLMDDSNSKPFLPGMSASADILTESKAKVLSIPIQAVTTRTDSTEGSDTLTGIQTEKAMKEVVFLYDKGKAVKKEVKTGIQDNTYIEIKEGLKEEDNVITAPYDVIARKLKDGTLVNKVKKEELYKKK